MEHAEISRTSGKLKLEYGTGESRVAMLWERRDSGTLETTFDYNGAVTNQVLFRDDFSSAEGMLLRAMHTASIDPGEVSDVEFGEIQLKFSCPSCGKHTLKRYAGSPIKGIPVVPTYACSSCSQHSYNLTKAHLLKIAMSNKDLFTTAECEELERDSGAFIAELYEYIIRIFASKKIKRVR